jgi:excisionase family DNA binding protein
MDERKTLTVEEAAQLLGVSDRHLYELIRRGEFSPALRLGRCIRISRERFDALLGEREGVPV